MKSVRTMNEIAVGDQTGLHRTISESDVYLFCGVTGDSNPLHLDEEYTKVTRFNRRVGPGGLVASTGTALTAAQLLGPGKDGLEIQLRMYSRFIQVIRLPLLIRHKQTPV